MKQAGRWLLRGLLLIVVVATLLVGYALLSRSQPAAVERHAGQGAVSGAVTVQWFGVTCLLIRDATSAILLDPFFTRPEGWLPLILNRPIAPNADVIRHWLQQAGVERLDAVAVSHSHYDHVLDAGWVARHTGATLLGSASTANVGRGAGLPESKIQTIVPGQPMTFGSFTITFIESRHGGATGGRPTGVIDAPLAVPAPYLAFKQGGTYSILIEHAAGTALLNGSAGVVPGSLQSLSADTALLGIALVDDNEAYLNDVVDAIGATRVMPVHWDDFSRPLDAPMLPLPVGVDVDGFVEHVEQSRPNLELVMLPVATPVALFPDVAKP